MVIRSLNVRFGIPFPLFCWKMFGGGPLAGCATPAAGLIDIMFVFVFS